LKTFKDLKESYTDYLRKSVLKLESAAGHCGDSGPIGHCSGYKEEDDIIEETETIN
jgi:hypothetical protein